MIGKHKHKSRIIHLFNGLIITALTICLAATDTLAIEASKEGNDFTLEEVVVTAQRREESLQTTAIAATAISGDLLNDKAVNNIIDLQFASPGLTISDEALFIKSVNIRGIGLASASPTVSNGVAQYVDGVFQPQVVGTGSFYDIQDVEVLRGPQGTFVGSNSTGGAIFINTKSPKLNRIEGYVKAEAGNYNAIGMQGAINVPLGDIFALRVAGIYSKHDSYYKDIGVYKNEPAKLDEKSGRVGALLKTDRFEALLKITEMDLDTGGYAVQPQGTLLSGGDIYTVAYSDPTKNKEKNHQSTLDLNYTLPGDIILRSLSGYQNKRVWNDYDNDGTAFIPSVTNHTVVEKEYTEEINLISPTDGRMNWVLGAYYQKNEIEIAIGNPPVTDLESTVDKITRGIFGQLAFQLTESLEMDGGIRYSDYEADGGGFVSLRPGIAFPGAPSIIISDLTSHYENSMYTGKLGLNWTVNSDNLLYVFASRGYKPGGYNSETFQFKPETVLDYEAGWKSTMLGGHLRTQFGVFYMDYENFQLDTINTADGMPAVDNIADGTVKGLELSAQAQFDAVSFDMGYSYVDSSLGEADFINVKMFTLGSTYPSCELVPGGIPNLTCTDYSNATASTNGGEMLLSPKHSFNAGIDYTFYMPGGMTLRPRINFSHIGEQWTYLTYDPSTDKLDARDLWSAQITLSGLNWKNKYNWSMEAFCENLTDKEYIIGKQAGNRTESYGRPRTIGVRASFGF